MKYSKGCSKARKESSKWERNEKRQNEEGIKRKVILCKLSYFVNSLTLSLSFSHSLSLSVSQSLSLQIGTKWQFS